jgi:hypothetical protein
VATSARHTDVEEAKDVEEAANPRPFQAIAIVLGLGGLSAFLWAVGTANAVERF